jgi:hypothetical protein
MPRKNQIAYGNAAQIPRYPTGRKELAPAASLGAMLNRLAGSKYGIIPTTNTTIATTAAAVITNIILRASPVPYNNIPMKTT